MLPSELLEKTGWCKEVFARDKNNKIVSVTDELACQFCIVGSMYKTGTWNINNVTKISQAISEKTGRYLFIADYNDEVAQSKEEVIELLKSVGL